jgi:hypothetical protein
MNSLFQNIARSQIIAENYEPEAQAFFTKGVTLGESALSTLIKEEVNSNFFKGGKDDGWYSKIKAAYLYVGGTSVWHSINAVDPDNYQSTFGGGPTQDANGITFSGVGQWQDANFARNILAVNNFSMGFYSRTTGSTGYCMGIEDTSGANKSVWIAARLSGDRFQVNYGTHQHDVTETDGKGFYSFSAMDAGGGNTVITQFKNGANLASATIANSNISLSAFDIFIGALNSNGAANYYSNRNMVFTFLAEGLTNTEMSNLYTRIFNLNTALDRP